MKLHKAKAAIDDLFSCMWDEHMQENIKEVVWLLEDHIKAWKLRKKTIIELDCDLAFGLKDSPYLQIYLHPDSFGEGEWMGIMRSIAVKLVKSENEIIGVMWNCRRDADPFAVGTVVKWAKENGYTIVCDLPDGVLPLSPYPVQPKGLRNICKKHDIDYDKMMEDGK